MITLLIHSAPICLVVSLTMVALEDDGPMAGFVYKCARHFVGLYGGIALFSVGFYALEGLFSLM